MSSCSSLVLHCIVFCLFFFCFRTKTCLPIKWCQDNLIIPSLISAGPPTAIYISGVSNRIMQGFLNKWKLPIQWVIDRFTLSENYLLGRDKLSAKSPGGLCSSFTLSPAHCFWWFISFNHSNPVSLPVFYVSPSIYVQSFHCKPIACTVN